MSSKYCALEKDEISIDNYDFDCHSDDTAVVTEEPKTKETHTKWLLPLLLIIGLIVIAVIVWKMFSNNTTKSKVVAPPPSPPTPALPAPPRPVPAPVPVPALLPSPQPSPIGGSAPSPFLLPEPNQISSAATPISIPPPPLPTSSFHESNSMSLFQQQQQQQQLPEMVGESQVDNSDKTLLIKYYRPNHLATIVLDKTWTDLKRKLVLHNEIGFIQVSQMDKPLPIITAVFTSNPENETPVTMDGDTSDAICSRILQFLQVHKSNSSSSSSLSGLDRRHQPLCFGQSKLGDRVNRTPLSLRMSGRDF